MRNWSTTSSRFEGEHVEEQRRHEARHLEPGEARSAATDPDDEHRDDEDDAGRAEEAAEGAGHAVAEPGAEEDQRRPQRRVRHVEAGLLVELARPFAEPTKTHRTSSRRRSPTRS